MPPRLAALLLVAASLTACQSQPAAAKVPAGPPFVLEAGEVTINDLITRSAAYLGWNILVQEIELTMAGPGQSVFKLQHRIETDREGCVDLLTGMLAGRNFAVVPVHEATGTYEAISLVGPRAREVFSRAPHRTPEEILARPDRRVPVTTIAPLTHANATIATNALRPYFASVGGAGGLTLGNMGNNNALVLTGMQDQVAAALKMLQGIDVPAAAAAAPTKPGLEQRLEALTRRIEAIEKQLAK